MAIGSQGHHIPDRVTYNGDLRQSGCVSQFRKSPSIFQLRKAGVLDGVRTKKDSQSAIPIPIGACADT